MTKLPRRTARARAGVVGLSLWLLAACAPAVVPVPLPTPPIATPTTVAHAPELRFALVGEVTGDNVWALFDSKGYSYNNYAVRSAYWPRLYELSIPEGKFTPMAAAGMAGEFHQTDKLFVASVPLKNDLQWSDGSPFTADDVAFTINTALSFRLGFDWRAYYDPDWIDHVEAAGTSTVTFYFKQEPSSAAWQYGALLGPIVQKAYWQPRLDAAVNLLPPPTSSLQIQQLETKVTQLQARVDTLRAEAVTTTGEDLRSVQNDLMHREADLGETIGDLSKAEVALDTAMQAARAALYSVAAADEPTLGPWLPGGEHDGAWINEANPAHPFGAANFDRVSYRLYPSEAEALEALQAGDVDSALLPNGLSPEAIAKLPSEQVITNPSWSAHFLIINPARAELDDRVLRRALSCAIDRPALVNQTGSAVLESLVPADNRDWWEPAGRIGCPGEQQGSARMAALSLLKAAGYSWQKEPSGEEPGIGLTPPGGGPLPPFSVLAVSEDADKAAAVAARSVEQAAEYLGIPLTADFVSTGDLRFAVFKSGNYDMAIVGWRLSAFPGYLCDWFGAGNPFRFRDAEALEICEGLHSDSDAAAVHQQIAELQRSLAGSARILPLYSGVIYEARQGIDYPFDIVIGGLSGAFGAPSLAVPGSP